MKQVVATVIDNRQVFPPGLRHWRAGSIIDNRILRLDCPEVAKEARPGQYAMVKCGPECTLPRPFSVHHVDEQGKVAIFFAVLEGGRGTEWLSQLEKGEPIQVFGPLGRGFSIGPASRNLLLVAGGVGIAPLCFLAEVALTRACSVTLVYGTHDKNRYPRRLLPPGVRLISATEDGSVGYHGLATDLIPAYADRADQVFACGPIAMYKEMYRRRNELLKGKPTQVSLEVRMGCGLGVCYGCTVKTRQGLKQVCQDGPVFELEDILWDELGL